MITTEMVQAAAQSLRNRKVGHPDFTKANAMITLAAVERAVGPLYTSADIVSAVDAAYRHGHDNGYAQAEFDLREAPEHTQIEVTDISSARRYSRAAGYREEEA